MLDIQYTEEGLKDLNYVIVSGKPKKGADPEIKGLFLGVKSIEPNEDGLPDELFLWIYNNNTVFILNLKHYSVSSVEVCIRELAKKTQTINFKDSEQCSAVAKLHIIQNALSKQKRIRTDELVEVDTYKNLPEYLAKMASTNRTGDSTAPATNNTHTSNKRTYNPTTKKWEDDSGRTVGYSDGYYNNYHSKEVETSVFKRTTRYSAGDAINNMKTKIAEIRSGKYKPGKLKKIPADDIKEEGKKEEAPKVVGTMTEEEDAYGGLFGGFAG